MTLHLPTFTDVLEPSSSDVLLPPPCLLLMLMRLVLLCTALMGRRGTPSGEAGGELAIAHKPLPATKHSRYPFTISPGALSFIDGFATERRPLDDERLVLYGQSLLERFLNEMFFGDRLHVD